MHVSGIIESENFPQNLTGFNFLSQFSVFFLQGKLAGLIKLFFFNESLSIIGLVIYFLECESCKNIFCLKCPHFQQLKTSCHFSFIAFPSILLLASFNLPSSFFSLLFLPFSSLFFFFLCCFPRIFFVYPYKRKGVRFILIMNLGCF